MAAPHVCRGLLASRDLEFIALPEWPIMSPQADAERDTRLIQSVDDATARMLFPERFQGPLSVTLVYPAFAEELAERAAQLETAAEVEHIDDPSSGSVVARRATFDLAHIEELHALYSFLEVHADRSRVEVLIDGKRIPLVREIWLPLLWSLRS